MPVKRVKVGDLELTIDSSHKYCIGFRRQDGAVFPMQSYETIGELERGYQGFLFLFGKEGDKEFGKPIPVERDGNTGRILNEMVEKHDF